MGHVEGATSSTCSVDPETGFEMTQSSKPDAKKLCPNDRGSTNRDYLTLARGYERKTREHYKSGIKRGSKRSSEEKSNVFRRIKIRYQKEALKKMLIKQKATAEALKQKLREHTPISILACLQKLDAFEDISDEAIIAVHEAIKDNNDKKAALLSWDRPRLRKWIEDIVAAHPHFNSRSPWK